MIQILMEVNKVKMNGGGNMMSMMGGSMILNMIVWIIVLGFLIYGVVLLISKSFDKKEDSPLKILRERFARGEIDDQEFEAKKAVLRGKD
ncbi:SHOCT domain-containing protein [Radiobacillus sp. PE A8.2]|uniref:SHOCT domain-containing protein n=1 Tax=Radiobacillus sp. PE A8.2 TaxID=3380349 RepID=UPI00388DF86F